MMSRNVGIETLMVNGRICIGRLLKKRIRDLHPDDIAAIGLEEGNEVQVSRGSSSSTYLLRASVQLKPGTAMLHSGGPSTGDGKKNANFFTPGTPEALGQSGSYNSGKIKIIRA